MKVEVNVDKILKEIGQDNKPAISVGAVKQVAAKVESLFRKAGYGITSASGDTTRGTVIEPTIEDIEVYVPKFKSSKPSKLKKGDLFLGFSVNGKGRPMVIAKIVGDTAYCIALTTTEDEYTLIPHQSRFLEPGFYCNNFILVRTSQITKSFLGIADDTRNLNKAIKLIKEKIKKDLL